MRDMSHKSDPVCVSMGWPSIGWPTTGVYDVRRRCAAPTVLGIGETLRNTPGQRAETVEWKRARRVQRWLRETSRRWRGRSEHAALEVRLRIAPPASIRGWRFHVVDDDDVDHVLFGLQLQAGLLG